MAIEFAVRLTDVGGEPAEAVFSCSARATRAVDSSPVRKARIVLRLTPEQARQWAALLYRDFRVTLHGDSDGSR